MPSRSQQIWKLIVLTLCFFPVLKPVNLREQSIIRGSSSAAMVLAGVVAESHRVYMTQSEASKSLELETGGSEIEIARIVENSNNSNPYAITISSANHGVFKAGVEKGPSYTLTYNSVPVGLETKSANTPVAVYSAPFHETVHVLKISFSPMVAKNTKQTSRRAPANENRYSDTVIFSIAAM